MATWSVGFGDESRLMTGIMRLWSMAGIWLQRTLQISRNRSLISGGSGVPGVEGRRSNSHMRKRKRGKTSVLRSEVRIKSACRGEPKRCNNAHS